MLRLLFLALLASSMLSFAQIREGEQKTTTVVVVKDGDCRYFGRLVEGVRRELRILTKDEGRFEFESGPEYSADWLPAQIRATLKRALQDPEADIVLTAGILCAQAASEEGFDLSKPVVSAFVQDSDAVGLPYNLQGRSTKKNFNFVVVPLRATRDLQMFKKMIGFRHLGIVVDRILQKEMSELTDTIAAAEKSLNARITLIPASTSASQLIEAVPDGLDGIYLTPLLRMDQKNWQKIIDTMNDRDIPTFSMKGRPDVELGALAGLAPDISRRLARRLALNMQQIADGVKPEDLPVVMAVEEQLTINARTAMQLGYNPSVGAMINAVFLHEEALEEGQKLGLNKVIELALENNAVLRTKSAEVEQSRYDKDLAFTGMLPMIESRLRHMRIDEDRSRASFGIQPESATVAGVAASQMVFNDKAISQYRSSKHLHSSRVEEQESVRLDVMASASTAYIGFLQARAIQQIARRNLSVTRKNLELARLRQRVGSAGPGEVYRWQTELASQNAELQSSGAAVERARLRLNQVMGVDMAIRWSPDDFEYEEGKYYFLEGRLKPILEKDMDFHIFEAHIVETALRESPLIKAYDKNIEAQRIDLAKSQRSFHRPEVSIQASYDYKIDEQSPQRAPALAAFDFPGDDDEEWAVGILASFPLFAGGSRFAEAQRSQARLEVLQGRRAEIMESIEERARNAVYAIFSSYPNVALQRHAAIYAHKNMEVVRRQYEQGVASIVDMLDAQNRAFAARQNQAVALYGYLADLVEMQRAMAWFEIEKNENQKKRWIEELRVEARGSKN